MEPQLNKANTSDIETSFLDLNIKVLGNDVHTSVYDKRDDFGFPIVNSPGWVVMFLDSHRMVFPFLSWLDLLDVVLVFCFSILKIFKLLPNYWHRVTDITRFEKHLESSSGHTLSFYPNLVKYLVSRICVWRNFMASSLWLAVGPRVFIRRIIYDFVWLHSFCG